MPPRCTCRRAATASTRARSSRVLRPGGFCPPEPDGSRIDLSRSAELPQMLP